MKKCKKIMFRNHHLTKIASANQCKQQKIIELFWLSSAQICTLQIYNFHVSKRLAKLQKKNASQICPCAICGSWNSSVVQRVPHRFAFISDHHSIFPCCFILMPSRRRQVLRAISSMVYYAVYASAYENRGSSSLTLSNFGTRNTLRTSWNISFSFA